MCGLTGFYRLSGAGGLQKDRAVAVTMESAISHRGPDGGGIWQEEALPLTLAHRRLAIIDVSQEGAQPMHSASGRYVIVYNGEIYNFQDLRGQLEAAGTKFRGRSDTEVFLAALDRWGLNLALQKIIGMFAIVLWDRQERTLHFIRDRLGKKPLYLGWASNAALVFGSELKSLRAHPDFKAEMNKGALANYMRFGYVCAPLSIYKNVWSLLPGHWLSLKLEGLEAGADLAAQMKPYWPLMRTAQEAQEHKLSFASDAEAVDEFEALLKTCTRERMISDVPLGAFLSGGIDSAAVVATMQSLSAKKIKTYTIGFDEAGFNEAHHAAKIAAHLGTDHHEWMLSADEARGVIPKLPDLYDEPFADISAIPTYLVSAFARKSVTVALSG
ncbi:MAG TPA: asparagine synthase (glutamine-hydrolyzing), partial [Alphaproteobacteria bacterium]|nr:asparagine synthase (glutamine-hydrolyzing) [Alphaproteobacteria bacterium]